MTATTLEARSLIDEFLPEFDFAAAYEIEIHAPMAVVYERLLITNFNAAWIVRVLLSLRTGKWLGRDRARHLARGDLRKKFEGTGFVVLQEAPGEEVVIGVAGKFWRPDGGRHVDLRAGDFVGFSREGEAKVAWNFRLRPARSGSTILSTETRIQCFGQIARWKFRLYWAVVAPFSGVIRKAILRQVKVEAEGAVA